jgi:hypothetical protein
MRLILRRLDERGEWGGRRLLRRKAYSFMHYRCSTAQACAGNHGGAVLRAAKSMIAYPLPYGRDEVRMPLDRPKRLVVNLLRLMRLKRPDPGPAANRVPATDALRSLRSANFDRSTPSPLSAM